MIFLENQNFECFKIFQFFQLKKSVKKKVITIWKKWNCYTVYISSVMVCSKNYVFSISFRVKSMYLKIKKLVLSYKHLKFHFSVK